MFRLLSESELLTAFRPRDRALVEPPPGITYPKFVRDSLTWAAPSGERLFVVLVEPNSGRPMGITFRRDHAGSAGAPRICAWCHSTGSSEEIGLLTAEATSHRRVGVLLCLDLECARRVEDAASRLGKNLRDEARTLKERMQRFAREALGIDFVPEA